MHLGKCVLSLMVCVMVGTQAIAKSSRVLLPEPAPLPYEQRDTPYSMVYYQLSEDEAFSRWCLGAIRDLGATYVQAAVWWYQYDQLDDGVTIDDESLRRVDLFVEIAQELGIRPALRLGAFQHATGYYHPQDASGNAQLYAQWVAGIAKRYKGKIHHYVIGDELNRGFGAAGWSGTPQQYLDELLIPLATAIRENDPDALIASVAVSSAPATDWQVALVRAGLPNYADGISANMWSRTIEARHPVKELMDQVREIWPQAKFFSNGVGYATNRHGIDDQQQAAVVAQTMYTLWLCGYDNAPYYLLKFSLTQDTRENYGLLQIQNGEAGSKYSAAWRAYQTIAQTFYNRNDLKDVDYEITLTPAQRLEAGDSSVIGLAPPAPEVHAYIREGRQLLIYAAYPDANSPREGQWNIHLKTTQWGGPQAIPMDNYLERLDVAYRIDDTGITLENITIGTLPTILTLRHYAEE